MDTTRTFGIELEAHLPTGKTMGQLADLIRRRARVSAHCEAYNHYTQAHWKLTTDSSLGYDRKAGVEVVSPILSGEAGIQDARRVTAAMQEFGCTISVKCGFHVHVGASDLSLEQLRSLAISFVHAETAFDAIMPPSRRRDLNKYILSNRTAFGGGYDNEAINRAIDAYKTASNTDALIARVSTSKPAGGWAPTTRYRKLNLLSMARQGTVEFRQHSGTVDPDKVENWVRLCVAFVERSKTSKPRQRPSTKPHVPSRELAALMKFLRASPEVRAFYRDRLAKLSDAQLQRSERQATAAGQVWMQPAE